MKRFTLALLPFLTLLQISCVNNIDNVISNKILLTGNWEIQQSSLLEEKGGIISSVNANTADWYPGSVPSTVMGVLTENGLYEDLFFGKNYKKADPTIFDVPWWYRTTFKIPNYQKGQNVSLRFDGISYRANVWLNGKQIASKDDMFGAFCIFTFDISDNIQEINVLAVEIFRGQDAEPNIGFVDWNPRPLDESMGIFRDVIVSVTGDVKMEHTRVVSDLDVETLEDAYLTIETELTNLSEKEVKGHLMGEITDRTTEKKVKFSVPMNLQSKENKIVSIDSKDVRKLHIKNPSVWWCNNLGDPNLYDIDLKYRIGTEISDEDTETFGIRDIEIYFTEEGHKGFILNGKKVLIKSAGWTDDIFLRDTPETNELQVQYVKDMNLNMIRFENVWGTSRNIYDLCDEYGLLSFVGWSCHWEWEGYFRGPEDEFGCIRTEEDMDLLTRYFNDQVKWLRNHPSIIAWLGGSDKLLQPELEKRYLELLAEIDDRPYVGAAKWHTSAVTGPTGMKMYGPYEYVGPNYWFIDDQYGGAYGFNTETGTGAQMPVLESIKKMIPEDKLWPLNDYWNAHCSNSATHLNNLDPQNEAINAMFGKSKDLDDYLRKAYLINYQSTKSMFEAFRVNLHKTTGIVQWMLNSAWPSLYWQLYDYYMIPVPAYYGVRTANQLAQLIYNYKDNGIYLVNETLEELKDVRIEVKGFDINSKAIYSEEISASLPIDSVEKVYTVDNSHKNSFVSLKLYNDENELIAENFYALSSVQDTYDWDKTDWCDTPMLSYGDFKDLSNLKMSKLDISLSKEDEYLSVDIENNSDSISFFNHLYIKDSKGEIIYPVFWEDNYISLLPGEKKTIKCNWDKSFSKRDDLELNVKGWNIKTQIIDIK